MRAFVLILILALVGLVDSVYLTAEHLRGVLPDCAITGCQTVLASDYASIGPIPTASLGIVYYGVLSWLVLMFLDRRIRIFAFLVTRMSVVGLVFSGMFVFIQIAVLGAICQYCMLSALICGAIFWLSARRWGLVF